ncbi:MAG: hypothetical protein A2977_03660 [Alphaproteobacteria bacterium RIFCSPLOWO2_01_FULL_45_8]|nr:MAG: hypothetical protein A2065_02165 [Alphaproteobacteria bacterium GWB1_45_5]OFW76406.1 MAG: hypothetical protein A3K20_02720 [Alphaproteobacteria bacterium GWA1_45_9]OFW89319.1 MAG: hypothetical protein A2621_00070 [Alphaproteobacteria bacterium RIFCSPHIGHO2_01_FULL_41_14]OFW95909.1 MAG: hypothetical protein A2977_03660 [Alphaproteobacteria bacterium RIFCSPLOWO2_01_FULL_45_8]HCI48297.1 hypothetical protein [Holosporales bacterium]
MKIKKIQEQHRRLKKEIAPKTETSSHSPSFKSMAWKASSDMVGAIIVGTGGGLLFDRFFHTPHWGLIIGFFLGSAAGLLNVYRGLCRVGYGLGKK